MRTLSAEPHGRMLFVGGWRVLISPKTIAMVRRMVPLVPLLVLFIVTGLHGVHFAVGGEGIDAQIKPVQEMVNSGLLVPRAAVTPTMTEWLVLLPASWRGLLKALEVGLKPEVIQAAMQHAVTAPDYPATVRRLFVVVSSLALVWVYGAALVLGRRWWEALIAASALGLSWEYAHRAVTPDCILVQFCALALFSLLAFVRSGRVKVLYLSALGAGMAIGTKFEAAPLVIVVVAAGASKLSPLRARAQLARAAALCATVTLAFILTTPAPLLEPFRYFPLLAQSVSDASAELGRAVHVGWAHLGKALFYFAFVYFSPYTWVSALLALGVVVGAVVLLRQERRLAALLVGFPALYLVFFCFGSLLKVRDFLLLAPFFGLLLAAGVGALVDSLPGRAARAAAFTGLALIALANSAYLVRVNPGEKCEAPCR